jgi:hypothetical protein
MGAPKSISEYLRAYGHVLGARVLEQFPPLHEPGDPLWPAVHQLKRTPFPAQALVLLCYKLLSPLRMMATAEYCRGDGCCPGKDPDGRGHLSTATGRP